MIQKQFDDDHCKFRMRDITRNVRGPHDTTMLILMWPSREEDGKFTQGGKRRNPWISLVH